MTRIYVIDNVAPMRSFESKNRQGQAEQVKVKGLTMCDGSNKLYGEAYGELAGGVEALNLQQGDVVQVNISSSVLERTKDGVTFLKNSVTINSLVVLMRASF